MNGATPLLLLCAFMVWTGKNFTFLCTHISYFLLFRMFLAVIIRRVAKSVQINMTYFHF